MSQTRASLLAIVIVALPLLGAGCSMPFQVAYVGDPSAEIQGIRYTLKRPAYTVGLQLDLQKAEVFDPDAGVYVAGPGLGCPDSTGCPDRDPVLSIKGAAAQLCIRNLEAKVLLTQELSQTMTFEIRNDDPASVLKTVLADSDLSVTVDDEGYLVSVTSKSEDQILPFVEAVAGLTVSMAKAAAAAAEAGARAACHPEEALGLDADQAAKFRAYLSRHLSLAARRRSLEAALARTEAAVATAAPADLGRLVEATKSVNQEIAKVSESLKIVSYDLPDDKYVLMIDGDQVAGSATATSKWVDIKLTSGRL